MQKAECSECNVIEYNIREKCDSEMYLKKTEKYGIKAVPTIVIDGKTVSNGTPTVERVKAALGS